MNHEDSREIVLSPMLDALVREGMPPLSDQEIDAVYGVGLQFYARERWVEASDLFRLLVLCRPGELRPWLGLAACHEALGDEERALALYRVAVATGGVGQHVANAYLARLLSKLGQHDEAREILETLVVDESDEAAAELVHQLRCALCDTQPSLERAS